MRLFTINEYFDSIKFKSNPILEGGAFGHMSHVHEDYELTFGELKELIKVALSGELDKETTVYEKLDGQALAVSWKNNRLIAARNKGDRKNFGANALTVQGVFDKFKDHPDSVKNAFSYAAEDLERSFSKLSKNDLFEIFGEGSKFVHLEIIWPESINVIAYDAPRIVFHSVTEYDEAGNEIDDYPELARKLEKVIFQVNSNIQKHFEIIEPVAVKIPKHVNFDKKKSYFISKINKFMSENRLSDNIKISDYLDNKFSEILSTFNDIENLTEFDKDDIKNRWVFNDKSFRLTTFRRNYPDLYNELNNYEKTQLANDKKKFIYPIEIIFLEFASELLKNITGYLAINPDKAVQRIKSEIEKARTEILMSKDESTISKLNLQLQKIEALGGFDTIIPSEGIVFIYKGKQYKFTGTFAPVNQITGLLKYRR